MASPDLPAVGNSCSDTAASSSPENDNHLIIVIIVIVIIVLFGGGSQPRPIAFGGVVPHYKGVLNLTNLMTKQPRIVSRG